MRRSMAAVTVALVTMLTVGALSPLVAPASATPDHYVPKKGVRFNNPYGTLNSERMIVRHLVRTINSVPRREQIRMSAWNVRSPVIAEALIKADRRGVSVQVVMDNDNANAETPNRDVRRMVRAFKGDKKRKPEMRSWLRRCKGSCRGAHGIPHSKFYLFSRVGKVENIVMYGSANATELSASIQWNDLHTLVNTKASYSEFLSVFNQMKKDRRRKNAYRAWTHGKFTKIFYPYVGEGATGDPIAKVFDKVKCRGATGGTGLNGRTKIRIAQTAMFGPRGIALAHQLASLHRRGCNIRIVYAMFGNEVLRIFRQESGRPIPLTHLAYDANDDGIYDRYVHMKSMTISGNYGGDTSSTITWNGSANWSSVALASDEIVGRWESRKITRKYAAWIDYMFTHRPAGWIEDDDEDDAIVRLARSRGVDPYALIRSDL
jgi:phosphatidylserine/phosphatidylglycerophosphate/cardiolipin synthase-like enzyme